MNFEFENARKRPRNYICSRKKTKFRNLTLSTDEVRKIERNEAKQDECKQDSSHPVRSVPLCYIKIKLRIYLKACRQFDDSRYEYVVLNACEMEQLL